MVPGSAPGGIAPGLLDPFEASRGAASFAICEMTSMDWEFAGYHSTFLALASLVSV
jgi:hypothetical protein